MRAWNTISSTVSGVLNAISTTISTIWNGIKTTISNVMNSIKTTVSNIWNSVKSAVFNTITGIKDTIVNGFNNAVNFVKNLASEAWSWGADIINGIVDGIKSKIQAVADAVTGVADKIKSFLHFSVPDEGPLTDTFKTVMSNVVSVVGTFMQDTLTEVTNIWNNIQANMNAVLNIWDNIKNGVWDRVWSIRDTVADALNSAANSIRNIANSSWQWGYDLMQNLVNGIRYMMADLYNSVCDVANVIWEHLHFSVPEKGPLTDFESWIQFHFRFLCKLSAFSFSRQRLSDELFCG